MSIPTNILKQTKEFISKPLSDLINLSFTSGKFPTIFKCPSVTPIFKKGSKLEYSNYRPISILSNVSKIFEKLVSNRLKFFLEQNKCLFESQYGFRSKHSIDHALIQITEEIRKAIDQNKFACGVFIDLQKAFDTVNIDILLKKIRLLWNSWYS